MKNTDKDYETNVLGFSLDENTTPDTDRLLEEASETRERNIAGKKHDDSGASTALEALNNVFKAFNTITDLGMRECENNSLYEDSSVNPDSNALSKEDSNSDQTDSESYNDLNGAEIIKGSDISTAKENCPTAVKKKLIDNRINKTPKIAEIVQKIEDKLYFMSSYEDDENRIRAIKRIKQKLSVFPSYDDLLMHIDKYIDSQENRMNAEVFFLFYTLYSMESPEKYHHFYRRSLFGNDYYSAGKGEEINMFLDSLPTAMSKE